MKNNIKNIVKGLVVLVVVTSASACNKFVELEPISQISESAFWKTKNDATAGVLSIYDAMQDTYRTKYYTWGELRGDNFIRTTKTSTEFLQLINNDLQSANDVVTQWDRLYVTINRANLAIKNIPEIAGYDPSILAEAHALRAFAYFDAVRVWGKVPLFLEPSKGLTDDAYKTQTDGAIIMKDVVLPDVLKAEELMVNVGNEFRFSKASIYCLQANIYWYLKDLPKAKIALDKFVALNNSTKNYSLVKNRQAWLEQFLADDVLGHFEKSTETVLNLKYDILEDFNQAGNRSLFFAGIPSFFISANLENKWTERFPVDSTAWVTKYPGFVPQSKNTDGSIYYGDYRYAESKEEGRLLGESRLAKYQKTNQPPNQDQTDIHIYRLSGILLMKAIIENQLDNKAIAIALLNEVRVARQLPQVKAIDFTTKDELENYLLDERQFELIGEGTRWWDLINTGKAVSVMNPINGQGTDKLLFPVFFRHLIDNPKLVQTSGYN